MKYPKLRELKEAVKALIRGPYTSRFPYEPHIPKEGFRGKPQYFEEDCMGCTACYQVCPPGAIEYTDEVKDGMGIRRLSIDLDVCIMCGQCQANCPTEKGIVLMPEFDLATVKTRIDKQKIEKELILCEACNSIIAPYEQLLWVAKKLGSLSFSNVSLILAYLGNIKLTLDEKPSFKEENEFIRSDRFKILCPRCRREAVLKS
ncbi:MAG: 4Fe-4S dicluster domain-containing protein [Candidatus Omnitrophica bacterium]|nr:4Fe-4S dicluster domain-containing protein [Candidatus Omnitrophota bacterium]